MEVDALSALPSPFYTESPKSTLFRNIYGAADMKPDP